MEKTFLYAGAFDQALDWDTSKVTNMGYMFYDAKAFNQELVWDTSAVTTMERAVCTEACRPIEMN